MAIYDDDNPRPEPAQEASRWNYNIGDTVIFVREIAESFSVQVRTA
jgi:hypothetical protein